MFAAVDGHSPLIVIGGAIAALGLVMTMVASYPRYDKGKLAKYLKELGFVGAFLGGVTVLIGGAHELEGGHSLLGIIALMSVVLGIFLILLSPKIVDCYAGRKNKRIHQSPSPASPGKPPIIRSDDGHGHEVQAPESMAVKGEVLESQSETN